LKKPLTYQTQKDINDIMNEIIQLYTYEQSSKKLALIKEYRDDVSEKKSLLSTKFIASMGVQGIVAPPFNFDYVASLLNQNVYHKFCIMLKKDLSVAFGIDFKNFKNVPKKLKKFLDAPNNNFGEDLSSILENSIYDLLVFNRITNEVTRNSADGVGLYHVNARNMYLKVSADFKRIVSYKQIFGGAEAVGSDYPVYKLGKNALGSSMLAKEMYDPSSDFYGVPYYMPALESIIYTKLIEDYIGSFFENNARPDFMLIVTGQAMSPAQKTELGTQLSTLKGIGNGHKALYMNFENPNVNVVIKELSRPVDETFRNTKIDYRDAMATMHGVPPKILGFASGGSGLGGGTDSIGALKTLVDVIVPPIQKRVCNFYNAFFQNEFGFNPEMTLQKANVYSDKDLAIIADLLKKGGIMTTNEARHMNKLPLSNSPENDQLLQSDNSSTNLGIEQDSIFNIDQDKNSAFSSQSNRSLAKGE